MANQPQQMTGQQLIANNAQMRAALLATSPRMRKNLGVFSGGTLGGTTRIKLYNVGIITRLLLKVSVSVDIGTATATLSPQAPFNLISRIRLTDFDGTDRINCTGFELFLINSVRNGGYYGYNNDYAPAVNSSSGSINVPAAVLSNPVVPTVVATGKILQFYLEVPLAFDPEKDLRGAILAQTALGEMYLNIDWNSLLYSFSTVGNADAVYNGASTSTVVVTAGTTINVQVWQEFLLPQTLGGQVPLPQLDLLTVYEIAGTIKSSDNLAANTEKLINFPNVRSVIGAYIRYVNNGQMNSAGLYDTTGALTATNDITQFRIIANGNNVLYDNTGEGQLFEQRIKMGSAGADIRPGTYFFQFRNKPIETALYGNVQLGVTPITATSTNFSAYVGFCFESFYTKGATLPGLSQSSG